MSKVSIGGQMFDRLQHNESPMQMALKKAHASKVRPRCLCTQSGVDLYIAHVGTSYFLKRMPGSGEKHSPVCDSYEPPSELSGLAEVNGRAIQENADTGQTSLKLDFALSKSGARGPNTAIASCDKASVRTDGSKLTPRGLLHLLWHEAEFTKWSPKMGGKRSWGVIRRYVLQAAVNKESKGSSLMTHLYMPEPFNSEHVNEIDSRRRKLFQQAFSGDKGASRSLMILVGEVKEFHDTALGKKMTIKHLPSSPFMVPKDLAKRIDKHFGPELECRAQIDTAHLIALATFERSDSGAFWINEICLMTVDENWIPFETTDEHALIAELVKSQRYFVKGLRFNLPKAAPLATAVLSDTGEKPTALYVSRQMGDQDNFAELQKVIEASNLPSWCWNAQDTSMPDLPSRATRPNPSGAPAIGEPEVVDSMPCEYAEYESVLGQ